MATETNIPLACRAEGGLVMFADILKLQWIVATDFVEFPNRKENGAYIMAVSGERRWIIAGQTTATIAEHICKIHNRSLTP